MDEREIAARDKRGFEDLYKRMTTPPPPVEEEIVVEKPSSFQALEQLGDDLIGERDRELPERQEESVRLWNATKRER